MNQLYAIQRISLGNPAARSLKTIKGQPWRVGLRSMSAALNSQDPEYQYLQRSKLPTDKFQRSLPRLPIPDLNKTCDRYLTALKPIIADPQALATTEKIIKLFYQGEGLKLHNELLSTNKRNAHTSYISEPWFEMYLKSRAPLPLNYNPFMAWKDDPKPEQNRQDIRAANYIISAMRFRRSLHENVLEPEVFHLNPKKSDTDRYRSIMNLTPSMIATYVSFAFKAFPLDMSQYKNLFHSTRIPGAWIDRLQTYPDSKHIIVMKSGRFFKFDILDRDGNLMSPSQIHTNIKHLCDLEVAPPAVPSLGVLTTMDRSKWAEARHHLLNVSQKNAESLGDIDSALFVVCLDDLSFNVDTIQEQLKAGHNFLHGCNVNRLPSVTSRSINRWFDKSFSVIFTKDGHAAINFEHSWGDGVAVLRFFNEIYQDTTKKQFVTPSTPKDSSIDPTKAVREVTFDVDDKLKDTLLSATKEYEDMTSKLDLNAVIYPEKVGRNYFKKKKLSPDAMMQLGFQLAFFQLYGMTPATYEACSTAAFKHGRTETVRPATSETKKVVEALLTPSKRPSNSEIRSMLDACSKRHYNLCKEASMGQGFDRHLFAMRILAEKSGGKMPELYTDPSYAFANHYTLSTSTLYGENFTGGGFGPVVQDGFGLGYGYIGNNMGMFCSAYNAHRNAAQFCEAFVKSIDMLYDVLEDNKSNSEVK